MTVFEKQSYIEEVAAYIRVSTTEQKLHGISLEAQVEKLQKYAEDHSMKIVEWYKDEGVSGRKLISKRPELQRMLHDVPKKRFRRIIFVKLDRFFRSVREYGKCMEILEEHNVIWTATEEVFDLSTPSGEAFVHMKLTMAQLEADQTGERIKMVNEYKVKSGKPLFGESSFPFCYTVGCVDGNSDNKIVVKRNAEVMDDLITHIMVNHSIRAGVMFVKNKHGIELSYSTAIKALKNEMICGTYRGNPAYCEPYISRETFEQLQAIIKRNPRTSDNEHTYVFSGLLLCPLCGTRLSGAIIISNKARNRYHTYRCNKNRTDKTCNFGTCIFENTIERKLLEELENIIESKKAHISSIASTNRRISRNSIDDIQKEIDRLNYSFQKNRISVEKYDKQYDELIAKIDEAKKELVEVGKEPDFERIKAVLTGDWKEIYKNLDNDHKRAFWRSFIKTVKVEWTKDSKRVIDIEFL